MATRTVANGGGNYNAPGTWVEGAVPTNADDVVFTATSGQLTVNVASAAKTFICTGYTGTLTVNNTLTVSGSVTLVSAMTITTSAGSPLLVINTTSTYTSNTKAWPYALTLSGTITLTLGDNSTISGTLTTGSSAEVITNNTLSVGGGFIIGSGGCSGTATINMTGTGTISGSGVLKNNLTFNTSGTITIGSINYNTGTITYTAGTMSISGTLTVALSTTFNTSGMNWNNVTVSAASTITLSSNLNGVGTLMLIGSTTFAGAFNVQFADLNITPANQITTTLVASQSYIFTHGVVITGTAIGPQIILSSIGGTRAILILPNGAPSLDLGFVTATDIDSSAGRTMWDYKGTISNTVNWQLLGNPTTMGAGFVLS